MMHYLLNGFLFFIPVFIWNAVLFKKLPEFYQPSSWDNIPKALDVSENIFRFLSFFTPVLFKIDFSTGSQVLGLILYIAGIFIYFTSWILQIMFRERALSKRLFFRAAPAYTTVIWLTGIGLIGKYTFIPNVQKLYFIIMSVFVVVHTCHSFIIWKKQQTVEI